MFIATLIEGLWAGIKLRNKARRAMLVSLILYEALMTWARPTADKIPAKLSVQFLLLFLFILQSFLILEQYMSLYWGVRYYFHVFSCQSSNFNGTLSTPILRRTKARPTSLSSFHFIIFRHVHFSAIVIQY